MESDRRYPAWIYRFSGALATKFVGRKKDREKVNKFLHDPSPGPRVIQFGGEGGIGKTRFVIETLRLARIKSNPIKILAADKPVDFYHHRYHSNTELMVAILDSLPKSCQKQFTQVRTELSTLNLKRAMVDTRGFRDQEAKVEKTFNEVMNAVSRQARIVLAFDTLERLVYQIDLEDTSRAESWDWLIESFPKWGNVTLVLAGRKQAEPLFATLDTLSDSQGWRLRVDVKPFNKEDNLDYFQAAEQVASTVEGAQAVQERIQDLRKKDLLQKYAQMDDRPIIFSLLLHQLCLGPVAFDEAGTDQGRLEAAVIGGIITTERLGDTIVALGRLPKGATAELLAGVMDISPEESQARIDEVKDLTFIKIRPADGRIFLHDQMYEMLDRQVYDSPYDEEAKEISGEKIDDYYSDLIWSYRDAFTAPFRAIAEDSNKTELTDQEMKQVINSLFERQTAMSERLFYRLRNDPARGMRYYYRYMREALRSPDPYFNLQLEAELLNLLNASEKASTTSDPKAVPHELLRGLVLLFPIVRNVYANECLEAFNKIKGFEVSTASPFAPENPYGLHANLLIWSGDCERQAGRPAEARALLEQAIAELERLLAYDTEIDYKPTEDLLKQNPRLWFLTASLAMAHYTFALLLWSQGNLSEAEREYGAAIPLWRDVRVHIELATTENDLSYVMSERGGAGKSHLWVADALQLRWSFAPVTHVSLSLNTAGIIAMRQGNYEKAIRLSESGLRLAQAVEGTKGRVTGLAKIALAEETRRTTTYATDNPSDQDREKLLLRALNYAQEAWSIFADHPERIRLAEALIEVGCAYRDLLNLYRRLNVYDERCIDCEAAGLEALNKAAAVASSIGNTYREMDALVNLAWLGFISGDKALYDENVGRVMERLDRYTYSSEDQPGIAMAEMTEPLLWTQLGKITTLRGWKELREFDRIREQKRSDWETPLKNAAVLFAESFEYSARYSSNYPGLQQASNQLLNKLKQLNRAVRHVFVNAVLQFEQDHELNKDGKHGILYTEIEKNFLLPD